MSRFPEVFRTFLKAHVKGHYRTINGKVIHVQDYDNTRPQGRAATLSERTVIGKHKSGTHYLRATDAADADAIQGAAKNLGIEITKRRAGANHHGRIGAYDHFHVEDPNQALAIHEELKKQDKSGSPEMHEPEPTAGQGQKDHGNASAGGNPPKEHFEPIRTRLPNGWNHTEGRDSKGNPLHVVGIDGAILGHGKTKEAAIAMADKATSKDDEKHDNASAGGNPPNKPEAADSRSEAWEASRKADESGTEDAHVAAQKAHEKAAKDAFAEGTPESLKRHARHKSQAAHHRMKGEREPENPAKGEPEAFTKAKAQNWGHHEDFPHGDMREILHKGSSRKPADWDEAAREGEPIKGSDAEIAALKHLHGIHGVHEVPSTDTGMRNGSVFANHPHSKDGNPPMEHIVKDFKGRHFYANTEGTNYARYARPIPDEVAEKAGIKGPKAADEPVTVKPAAESKGYKIPSLDHQGPTANGALAGKSKKIREDAESLSKPGAPMATRHAARASRDAQVHSFAGNHAKAEVAHRKAADAHGTASKTESGGFHTHARIMNQHLALADEHKAMIPKTEPKK